MLKHKTKSAVIASVMALFLLAVMVPVARANSTLAERQADSLPEMITMEQLLEMTGSSLAEPTEEYMATLNLVGSPREGWRASAEQAFGHVLS